MLTAGLFDYLPLFVQCLISGVFLVSGTTKLRDIPGFGRTIRRVVRVPPSTVLPLAWLVVTLELATAVLVWVPNTRIGLLLAVILLSSLAAVAFRAARLPERVPCRCFGRSDSPLGVTQGLRNLLLAGLTLAALFSEHQDGLRLPGVALTAVAAAVGLLAIVFLDDLTDLARP